MMQSVYLIGLFLTSLVFSSSTVASEEWLDYTKLPGNYSNHASFVGKDGKFLYVVGGSILKDSSRKVVLASDLYQNDLPWADSSHMNRAVIWHSPLFLNDYVYTFGGFDEVENFTENLSRNEVEFSKVGAGGTLSTWTQASSSLPYKGANGSSTGVGNTIYYSGGGVWGSSFNQLSIQSGIYSALQGDHGELSSWELAGQLPAKMLGHQLVYTGKKLYLIGGYNADEGAATGQIFEAVMDSDGKITSWNGPTSNKFPDGNYKTYSFMHAIVGNVLVVAGGRGPQLHDPRTSDQIFFSNIGNDGSIGPWKESALKLPKPLCCAGIAVSGDKIYITGGHDGANYFDNVWSTTIDDIIGTPPAPTNTPTPIVSPPVEEKPYLVFVPGMFTSWNSEAIVHGKKIRNEEWVIPNSIDVYDKFLETLYSVGYEKDNNLWIYNYDWRRNILRNGQDLKQYILDEVLHEKPVGSKVAIIGHSMGGLVSRAAVDEELSGRISHLITLGSPHSGAVMAYPVWEGADFSEFTGLQSVLMRSYLKLNSMFFDSRVLAVHELVPSLQNLLPNWNFLKNKKGELIELSSMVWKNNVLSELDALKPLQSSFLYTLGGFGNKTLYGYQVDKVPDPKSSYGAWLDGKPIKKGYSQSGDNAVLLTSSLMGPDDHKFEFSNTDHGEIVTKNDSQNKVLELLDLSTIDRIENSKYKKFDRSVVVIMGSPVTFTLIDPDGVEYFPDDNLLLLDEPKSGQYIVNLQATEKGNFTLHFGRMNGSDEAWEIERGFVQNAGQKISYNFEVDFLSSDLGADPLNNLRNRLNLILNLVKPYGFKNAKLTVLSGQLRKDIALSEQLKTHTIKPAKKMIVSQMDTDLDLMFKFVINDHYRLDSRIKEEVIEELRMAKSDLSQYTSDLGLFPN